MVENIEFKELVFADINDNLLDNFDAHQQVKKWWQNKGGNWELCEGEYIVDWDKIKIDSIIKLFINTINNKGGYIFGAYEKIYGLVGCYSL